MSAQKSTTVGAFMVRTTRCECPVCTRRPAWVTSVYSGRERFSGPAFSFSQEQADGEHAQACRLVGAQ